MILVILVFGLSLQKKHLLLKHHPDDAIAAKKNELEQDTGNTVQSSPSKSNSNISDDTFPSVPRNQDRAWKRTKEPLPELGMHVWG